MKMRAVRLAERPDIWAFDGFFSDSEIEAVTALFLDEAWLNERAMTYGPDKAGFCAEAETETTPVLISARNRVADALGLPREAADSVRFRWYQEGNAHRPHTDAYVLDGTILAVSALIYLAEPDEGGETVFENSLPDPVRITPVRGRLVAWTNLDAHGNTDPHSRHEAMRVWRGEKGALLFFFYLPRPARDVCIVPPRS
jgi:hypothetical protein